MYSIDLNADLGEHPDTSLDERIMPHISSCNIACGGHIGDRESVLQTIKLAKEHKVAIGAHPSYPDRANFGRAVMDTSFDDLKRSLIDQITLVGELCIAERVHLNHVKPHGALYNQAAKSDKLSQLILEVIKETTNSVSWVGLAGSCCEKVANENQFSFIAEGFADRQYEPDGSLRSRSFGDAILGKRSVLQQVEDLALYKRVNTKKGWIPVHAQSICLHSDTEGAVILAKEIREHLESKGIQIASV